MSAHRSFHAQATVEESLLEMMKGGAYFYKHDFGRSKRGRKHVKISADGTKISWKGVGERENVGGGGSILRSASFSRVTTTALSDVLHIVYGPYTDTFIKKTVHDRVDPRHLCFSLVLRESRTIDFAAEDEPSLLPWLLGLQQLVASFAATPPNAAEVWTLPKLRLQKMRLRIGTECDRTGQGPYDVLLGSMLDVAQYEHTGGEKATVLQAAWRRRNTQGKFQVAVQEMMEIQGLISEVEALAMDAKAKQEQSQSAIAAALTAQMQSETPPPLLSEKVRVKACPCVLCAVPCLAACCWLCDALTFSRFSLAFSQDMMNPEKVAEYQMKMGAYSMSQQIQLEEMEGEVRANQAHTAELNALEEEKRRLENMANKLQFGISNSKMVALSDDEKKAVQDIQSQLACTPRGTIKGDGVRMIKLYKESQTTRLGIIFHQQTPAQLGDVESDLTPRPSGQMPVVIPVIKTIDPNGAAGQAVDLNVGDQVLSINGEAALSNIEAVKMLREAIGDVVLAVRETPISQRTPRGVNPRAPAAMYGSGLRVKTPQ